MLQVTHLPQRLARWFVFSVLLAGLALALAGRADLPMLVAFLVVCAALMLVAALVIDPDLARERFRRGQTGEDGSRLVAIRVLFLVMFVYAVLDIGRLHWSDVVPTMVQVFALALFALALLWTEWAVVVNRFFLPVIRLQSERGHRVVDAGPYGIVRHPGYAAMIVMPGAAALALGSLGAAVLGLGLSGLFIARTAHEDRFLRAHLDGYAEYAARVRYRLLPKVW
ncbi:MAG TPA: isoprenylcysteine carboxylmethyltransferase family protein [Candidatus Eisenbacteria bacterium]|nr:isoprenylcysteine carboxylmethyltransferase family protein [Candidatus Eisenbacteria bacterium]